MGIYLVSILTTVDEQEIDDESEEGEKDVEEHFCGENDTKSSSASSLY